jgi:hypothetical protein
MCSFRRILLLAMGQQLLYAMVSVTLLKMVTQLAIVQLK